MKYNKIDGARNKTGGGDRKCVELSSETMNRKDQLGDIGIDGIILKWILLK
jgi:hypothetical protein